MSKKLCEIKDLVPVRVFPNSRKKMGPIAPMYMSDALIFSILNSRPAPVHFYAIDPNDSTNRVLLTKDNYNKTNEELFPSRVVSASAKKVEDVEEPVVEPIVNDAVVEEVVETNEIVETAEEPEAVIEPTINDEIDEDVEGEKAESEEKPSNTYNKQNKKNRNRK